MAHEVEEESEMVAETAQPQGRKGCFSREDAPRNVEFLWFRYFAHEVNRRLLGFGGGWQAGRQAGSSQISLDTG